MKFKRSKYGQFFLHPLSVLTVVAPILFFSDKIDVPSSEADKINNAEDVELLFPQAELSSSAGYIVVPLKNSGKLFMVDAVIDGQSGNLIFDTGATDIVLNKTYFRKYVTKNSLPSNCITGNVNETTIINIDSLKISDLVLKKFHATLADLGHIENSRGIKVLGLFGFAMLKNFEIIIDIPRQQLQLYRIDAHGDRINRLVTAFVPVYSQKLEVSKEIVFVRATIAGKELRFCLDTGAETNAISSNISRSVLSTVKITNKSKLQGVGSGQPDVLLGTMTEFRFGNQDLAPMVTLVSNLDPLSDAYEKQTDGMLGYEFLKKGTICINFVKKQIGIIYTNK
jgi:predicted aspartyl protease